ncbi:Mediator of RNA polymerase II transcription subunit [Trichinella spiralis]|uniref:Mediator of RNA polymerase II transcription subunit n=1 Tax=Trichinella spiralis TaxID=6334 RepID=A0ABR3KPT4_TRISP
MNFLKFVITFCFVSCTAASFIINSMPAAQRKEYENLVNQFQLEKKIMADSLSSASRIEFLKEMWKKKVMLLVKLQCCHKELKLRKRLNRKRRWRQFRRICKI